MGLYADFLFVVERDVVAAVAVFVGNGSCSAGGMVGVVYGMRVRDFLLPGAGVSEVGSLVEAGGLLPWESSSRRA